MCKKGFIQIPFPRTLWMKWKPPFSDGGKTNQNKTQKPPSSAFFQYLLVFARWRHRLMDGPSSAPGMATFCGRVARKRRRRLRHFSLGVHQGRHSADRRWDSFAKALASVLLGTLYFPPSPAWLVTAGRDGVSRPSILAILEDHSGASSTWSQKPCFSPSLSKFVQELGKRDQRKGQ